MAASGAGRSGSRCKSFSEVSRPCSEVLLEPTTAQIGHACARFGQTSLREFAPTRETSQNDSRRWWIQRNTPLHGDAVVGTQCRILSPKAEGFSLRSRQRSRAGSRSLSFLLYMHFQYSTHRWPLRRSTPSSASAPWSRSTGRGLAIAGIAAVAMLHRTLVRARHVKTAVSMMPKQGGGRGSSNCS